MSKKSAQQGVVALPLVIGGAVVLILVISIASGALKFNFKVTKTNESGQKENVAEVGTPAKPQEPAVKLAETAYTNADLSLSYPEGWKVQEAKNMISITRKSPDGGILIITSPLGVMAGAKLATIADANKLVALQQFKNANFLSEEETTLNGQPAWRYTLTANNDGTDIKVIYYVLADSKNMYVLIGTSQTADWLEMEPALSTSLATFKLAQ